MLVLQQVGLTPHAAAIDDGFNSNARSAGGRLLAPACDMPRFAWEPNGEDKNTRVGGLDFTSSVLHARHELRRGNVRIINCRTLNDQALSIGEEIDTFRQVGYSSITCCTLVSSQVRQILCILVAHTAVLPYSHDHVETKVTLLFPLPYAQTDPARQTYP